MENIDFYTERITTHPRTNRFLRYFPINKETHILPIFVAFLFTVLVIESGLILLSIFIVYFLWEYLVAIRENHEIIERCIIDEEFIKLTDFDELQANFPEDPLYITNGDRDAIIDSNIGIIKGNSIISKIKKYYKPLIIISLFYFALLALIIKLVCS